MTPQEITQLKGIALQLAQGDLDKAKGIYAWLKEDVTPDTPIKRGELNAEKTNFVVREA